MGIAECMAGRYKAWHPMRRVAKAKSSLKDSDADLGFGAKRWLTANKLRKPMFDSINRNTDESRTLATPRDTLLPKVLSGKHQAPDPHS